jgi:hypothetical protein
VAEKVVSREYVIDLKTVRAGISLANVALEKALAVHEVGALAIVEEALGGRAAARLTRRWRECHGLVPRFEVETE